MPSGKARRSYYFGPNFHVARHLKRGSLSYLVRVVIMREYQNVKGLVVKYNSYGFIIVIMYGISYGPYILTK